MSGQARHDKLRVYDRWLNGGLLLATFVLVSVTYLAIVLPLETQRQAIDVETDELALLVQRTPEITRKHQALEARLTALRKQTEELWQRIPTAPRESDYLAQVCHLAERTGMHVADYHPGTSEPRENHHELEVKIATRGEYGALCRFLEQVDQIPRLCRMTQLEVTAPAGDLLSADVTYRIYFAPGNASSPAKKG